MTGFLRRWGAVVFVGALFVLSWAGQLWAMWGDIQKHGWAFFWSATFENWQSEFLQLAWQGVAFLALKHAWFKADAQDMERLEGKVDKMLDRIDDLRSRAGGLDG